jgi:hypothetical protein
MRTWARGGRGRVALVAALVLLGQLGTREVQAAQAARGRKETLPIRRTPKLPKRLPAAAGPEARAPIGPRALERIALSPGPGEYADSLEQLAPGPLAFERSGGGGYAYCLRVSATYEQVYFDSSGQLRRGYSRAVQHGTGFAYRHRDGEYFVATSHHVVSLPEVTGPGAAIDGVPAGSRKVREVVHIVRNEDDDRAAGFVELTPVLADPARDLAILKTRRPLELMPWRFGRSADLRVGNVVLARGYPLGVLAASNVGRVTSTRHLDTEGVWDHVDFVTDASLNNGNSGSPVFAISRRTREPELVGIFHARYRDASGMGVVVGIDQLRDALEHLRVPEPAVPPVAGGRDETTRLLAAAGRAVYFPFAGQTARALAIEGGARFELFEDFPVIETAELALISAGAGPVLELPLAPGARAPASGGPFADALREHVEHLERELWGALGTTLRLRRALAADDGSAGAQRQISRLRGRLEAAGPEQRHVLSAVGFHGEVSAAAAGGGEPDQPRRLESSPPSTIPAAPRIER